MTARALRSIDCTTPESIEAPALVPAAHAPDLIAENARLERENNELRDELAALARDNRSLQNRTRFMTAALIDLQPREGELPTPTVVGVYGAGRSITALVTAAQTTEVFGDVPAIRFVRDAVGVITGVELVRFASEGDDTADGVDEFDPTFRTLALITLAGDEVRA